MDKKELKIKVKTFVEENKLQDALTELEKIITDKNDENSLVILLSRIKDNNQKEIRGTASFQNINIEKNKIRESILELTDKVSEDLNNNISEVFPIQRKDDVIEGLVNEIKSLREEYKSSINNFEDQNLKYLTDKYKYGFIAFGIFDGEFIFTPIKKVMNSRLEIDWKKTNINFDEKVDSYILNISNLKWTFSVENISKTTTTNDSLTCILPKFPKERVSYNLGVLHMFFQPALYFEMLKNSSSHNVYVIGFKQKEIGEY